MSCLVCLLITTTYLQAGEPPLLVFPRLIIQHIRSYPSYNHHRIQTFSAAHIAPYPMGTNVSFPEGKAAGA